MYSTFKQTHILMKKILILVGIVLLAAVFSLLALADKGEKIIRQAQLEIEHIEAKIIINQIELEFSEASLRTAMIGGESDFNKESSRLRKIAIETDSLMDVRDNIYLRVPGTRIRPL